MDFHSALFDLLSAPSDATVYRESNPYNKYALLSREPLRLICHTKGSISSDVSEIPVDDAFATDWAIEFSEK